MYQLILTHIVIAFFVGQGLFEGKSITKIQEKLYNGYTTALVGNYKVNDINKIEFIVFFLTLYKRYGQLFKYLIFILRH